MRRAIQKGSQSIMTTNLFTNLPSDLPDELFTTLLDSTNLRIERVSVHAPWVDLLKLRLADSPRFC
jgi:hypothetical protein